MRICEDRRWLPLVALGLLCACGAEPDGQEKRTADLDRIEAVADTFVMAVRQQNAEKFANLFTSDAIYASNDGRLWRGRDEILAAAREWMQVPQDPSRTIVETKIVGNFAYVFDTYSSLVQLPNAPPVTDREELGGISTPGEWELADQRTRS